MGVQSVLESAASAVGALGELAAKGTLLLVFASALQAVGKRLRPGSAGLRHAIWAGALVGLLVLTAEPAAALEWRVLPWGSAGAKPLVIEPLAPVAANEDVAVDASAVTVMATPVVAPAWSWTHAAGVLVCLWGLGAALLVVRLALGGWRLLRMARGSVRVAGEWQALVASCRDACDVRRPVRVAVHAGCAMPLTFGLVRPWIILPPSAARWTQERRRIVLLHEMTHIARADMAVQIAAAFAQAIFWFHPLVWHACTRLQLEREQSCDDRLLAMGTAADVYAGTLVDIAAAGGAARRAGLAMARSSTLEARVRRVLAGVGAGAESRRSLAAGLALVLTVAIVLGVAQAAAPSTAPIRTENLRGIAQAIAADADSAATLPNATAPAKPVEGEYYIMGNIARPGVYSLTNRKINILQALAAAGLQEPPAGLMISLIRRPDDTHQTTTTLSFSDLVKDRTRDVILQANDILMVSIDKHVVAQGEDVLRKRRLEALMQQRDMLQKRIDQVPEGPDHPLSVELQKQLADFEQQIMKVRNPVP